MDDDDFYGPHFLLDLLLAREYSGADVVGTPAEFVFLEDLDRTVRRHGTARDASERFASIVAGGTITISAGAAGLAWAASSPYAASSTSSCSTRCRSVGGTIYRSHGLGFMLRRSSDGHTWTVGDEHFLDEDRLARRVGRVRAHPDPRARRPGDDVSDFLKRAAVRHVKPRLSPERWDRLRGDRQPPQRPDLTQIAARTGTDKWGVHFYTPHYERHLSHLRDEAFVLLEIGVGGYARNRRAARRCACGSATSRRRRSWASTSRTSRSWTGRASRRCRPTRPTRPRSSEVLDRFGVPRVVIDDGSHRPADILATFGFLFPMLPDGAFYAIEDTQTSYWPEFGGQEDPGAPGTTMAFVKALVDGLNHEEFLTPSYEPTYTDRHVRAVHCYHNLVVLEKGDNARAATSGQCCGSATERVPDGSPSKAARRYGNRVDYQVDEPSVVGFWTGTVPRWPSTAIAGSTITRVVGRRTWWLRPSYRLGSQRSGSAATGGQERWQPWPLRRCRRSTCTDAGPSAGSPMTCSGAPAGATAGGRGSRVDTEINYGPSMARPAKKIPAPAGRVRGRLLLTRPACAASTLRWAIGDIATRLVQDDGPLTVLGVPMEWSRMAARPDVRDARGSARQAEGVSLPARAGVGRSALSGAVGSGGQHHPTGPPQLDRPDR